MRSAGTHGSGALVARRRQYKVTLENDEHERYDPGCASASRTAGSNHARAACDQIRQRESEADEKSGRERKPHVGEVKAKLLRPVAPRGDGIVVPERRCTFAVPRVQQEVVDASCISDVPGSGDQPGRAYGNRKVAQPDAELWRPHEEHRPSGEHEARDVRDRHRPRQQGERDEQSEGGGPAGAPESLRAHESP